MSSLAVPILLLPEVIRDNIEPGRPGAYVLGNDANGFVAGYVGRSDYCLRSRLLCHNHLYEYDYLIFKYTENWLEAYHLECLYWHALCGEKILSNVIHPASPKGSSLVCPYCDFAYHVNRLLVC